jgi:hypothetical protein
MGYEYTVFISYSRRLVVADDGEPAMSAAGEWVHRVLVPHLERWLPECAPGAKIAFDGKLPQGADPRTHVKHLLKSSCCMLAVWSAEYFWRPWCVSEWRSMQQRERPGKELVVPLVFSDGEFFDADARQRCQGIAAHRMRPFTFLGAEHEGNACFPDFRQELARVCGFIRDCARRAPDWRDDFPWIEPDAKPAARPVFGPPSYQA